MRLASTQRMAAAPRFSADCMTVSAVGAGMKFRPVRMFGRRKISATFPRTSTFAKSSSHVETAVPKSPVLNADRRCGGKSAGEMPQPTNTTGASTTPPPALPISSGVKSAAAPSV